MAHLNEPLMGSSSSDYEAPLQPTVLGGARSITLSRRQTASSTTAGGRRGTISTAVNKTAGADQQADEILNQTHLAKLAKFDTKEGDQGLTGASHIICGNKIRYHNHFMFHVPFANVFWPTLDDSAEPPTFQQISDMMNVTALVAALVLAFVITIHVNNNFQDMSYLDSQGNVTNDGADWRFRINPETGKCNTKYCNYWRDDLGFKNSLPSEMLNWNCVLSEALLSICLVLSILIVGTAGANVFCREHENMTGHQSRQVIKTYMKWARFPLIGALVAMVMGCAFFFWAIEKMIILQFPDYCVEQTGHSSSGGSGTYCPFDVIITAVNWGILTPALIGLGFISMATHRAYRYPLRPDSDTKTMWQERVQPRKELTEFLAQECACDHNPGSIFLSAAGGISSCESEVIADALLDNGIITKNELLTFVKLTDGEILNDIDAIQLSAKMKIRMGCHRFSNGLLCKEYMGREENPYLLLVEAEEHEQTKRERTKTLGERPGRSDSEASAIKHNLQRERSNQSARFTAEKQAWVDKAYTVAGIIKTRMAAKGIEEPDSFRPDPNDPWRSSELNGLANLLVDLDIDNEEDMRTVVEKDLTDALMGKGLSLGTITRFVRAFSD